MTERVVLVLDEAVLRIFSGNDERLRSEYDFQSIGFSGAVASAMARAFIALQGTNTIESLRAGWICIKRFANFSEKKYGKIYRLPPDCLSGFDGWMKDQGLGLSSIARTHNVIIRMLRWCLRNVPPAIHEKTMIFKLSYASDIKKSRSKGAQRPPAILDENLVKEVLKACYEEIEKIEERISQTRKFIGLNNQHELARLLTLLLKNNNGVIPNQKEILSLSGGSSILLKLKAYGGLRSIAGQFHLTAVDTFPFYLAILIQSMGNPQSLLHARNDCIVPVPMRSDLERIVWDKARAGREQALDFSKNKEWSAPNLVRRLNMLNKELRPIARARNQKRLFLCRNSSSGIAPPSWQTIHNNFRQFRLRHGFPKFDLRDIRRFGGMAHHRAARSLRAAQQRLNHAHETTTQIYTPLSDLREMHDRNIFRFQGILISEALKCNEGISNELEKDSLTKTSETLFGFGCIDPFKGIAAGSKKGETCLHFQQCATCPGALIVVDDPKIVAKLVRSKEHLINERSRAIQEGWINRFDAVYAPTLAILQRDIFPGISSRIIEEAKSIPVSRPPFLE